MISRDLALILFARLPRSGEVKTRLTPRYTPEEALQLHEALFVDSLDLMNRCAAHLGAGLRLYLSDSGILQEDIAAHLGAAQTSVQLGSDLGERLGNALRECLQEGHSRVVALGSDTPHLPDAYVSRAFEALSISDMVVGPARDGGFYLLGASRLHESLLTGMPWGTAQLYRETVRKARKEAVSLLPSLTGTMSTFQRPSSSSGMSCRDDTPRAIRPCPRPATGSCKPGPAAEESPDPGSPTKRPRPVSLVAANQSASGAESLDQTP
jgi:rSAM/selenodomain-associated transferase 1